ncbi:MAG: hypothetical protein ABW220_05390 [Burkholderiaceae bacterium]
MNATRLASLSLLGCLLAAAALPASAADTPPEPPATVRDIPEVKVERIVQEDEKVRIEETRVRGLTQKVVVKNKDGVAPEYEILLGDTGRDIPSRQGADRGNAGQRVWRLMSF